MIIKEGIVVLGHYPKQVLESASTYATGTALTLYGFVSNMDVSTALGMLGGFILFVARAAVDVPKAIDFWKERRKKR